MTLSAQLKWTNGYQFVARPENGPAVIMDSTDGRSGPTPMEMILIGVAGCTAIDLVYSLKKKNNEITDFKVNITGEQAAEHPKRFTDIHVEYVLYGRDIQVEDVDRAIQLSKEKYCSGLSSLNARFDHSYQILEEAATSEADTEE